MIHDTILKKQGSLPLVTFIIPVYNTQDYLSICLQSVLDQTYSNFEVICIDDGSTDRSAEIIHMFMRIDPRIQLIQIENHGQGYARNLALGQAKGKYIFFLDSDDYIENITLEIAVTRAEQDQSDFVVFDWCYYQPIGQTYKYVNRDAFFRKNRLEGRECLELLQISPIFSVNKLYKLSFLQDYKINFAEGFIYEDNPFWMKAVICAQRVSLIHAPLYRCTINLTSSTRADLNTDKHCSSYIKAMSACIEIIHSADDYLEDSDRYTLALYFIQKFMYYYFHRTPKGKRREFLDQFLELISSIQFADQNRSKLLSFGINHHVFSDRRKILFKQMIYLSSVYKPIIKSKLKKIRSKVIKLENKILHRKPADLTLWQKYQTYLEQPLYLDVILFMGFDHRYTGNSRYLFEDILPQLPHDKKVFFVTNDPLVPLQYRIEPGSDRCNRFVARSKVIIFESWIPLKYTKRSGMTWIQLWHGTPLKRMLFDSPEKNITTRNPANKNSKFTDIQRWDYMIVDNPNIKSYFQTAFLFPPDRAIACGYPRVKYLLEKKENTDYITKLKQFYRIPEDKKVVLYLPTWRDYNYGVGNDEFNMDYLLDLRALQERLGEDYVLIYKDHVYLSKSENVDFKNYNGVETQELLLVSDFLVTDYSSVMFDAFAMELPVILFCNDFEKNEESRGVYGGMWRDLSDYVCTNSEEIARRIQTYVLNESYFSIREKYAYKVTSEQTLSEFILDLGK